MSDDSGSLDRYPSPVDFLSAEDEGQAELILNRLFERTVIPQIRSTLASYLTLTREERDEIISDAQIRTLAKLRSMRESADNDGERLSSFSHFSAYVSAITINCRKDLILRKQPEWRRIGNRLRRLSEEDNCQLEFFSDDNGTQLVRLMNGTKIRSRISFEDLVERIRRGAPNHLFWTLQEAIPKIFDLSEGALPKHDLMKVYLEVTESTNFEEVEFPEELADVANFNQPEYLRSRRQKGILRLIWNEIRVFPVNQRKVLLLSLRETRETEAVTLLLRKRIATISEIAEALEVGLEEFSALFERLPMSSTEIADFLGIENGGLTSREQKVDNLRRIARDRLRRRLGIKKSASGKG